MAWIDKINHYKSLVTVEPIFALYKMGYLITGPATKNLQLEKSCLTECKFNETVCNAIIAGDTITYMEEARQVHVPISKMHAWNQPIQCIMPVLLILFWGSYSDRRHIRKPFLIMPMFAEIIAVTGMLLNAIYLTEWSLMNLGFCVSLLPSLFGDYIMLEVAMFSFIADISTEEERTIRMSMLLVLLNVCPPFMQSFNARLFKLVGYYPIYCISILIQISAILYGIFLVKEPRPPVPRDPNVGFFMDLFDPSHLIDTLTLPFTKKPGKNRMAIFILILLLIIFIGLSIGEFDVLFLYMNLIFGYTVVEFTNYSLFMNLLYLKGSLISIPIFYKWFQFSDYSILIFCNVFKIISNIVWVSSVIPWVFFTGTYLGLFNTIIPVVLRSMGTKIVPQEDTGKAQSLFGIFEALGPAALLPVYQLIYIKTLAVYPVAFLWVAIILCPLAILLVLYLKHQNLDRDDQKPEEKAVPNDYEKNIQMEECSLRKSDPDEQESS